MSGEFIGYTAVPPPDLVLLLRAHVDGDHDKGCAGRQYSCECGYDKETDRLLEVAAAEIERLRGEQIWALKEIMGLRRVSNSGGQSLREIKDEINGV